MNIQFSTVVLRPRNVFEIFDVAFFMMRRHGVALTVIGCLSVLPWVFVHYLLFFYVPRDPEMVVLHWYLLYLLLVVQMPLVTGPVTIYLGEALFTGKGSVLAALFGTIRKSGRLLWLGIVRGVYGIFPPILWLWPAHHMEVTLLEGSDFMNGYRRANALVIAGSGAQVSLLLLSCLVLVLALFVVGSALASGLGLVAYADPWQAEHWQNLYQPCQSIAGHVAMWLAMLYLSIVRFFAYIDLRTRSEGWAVNLDLRRAADRLQGPVS